MTWKRMICEAEKEDCERIVACVNAMAGITDPAAFRTAVDAVIKHVGGSPSGMSRAMWCALGDLRSVRDKH